MRAASLLALLLLASLAPALAQPTGTQDLIVLLEPGAAVPLPVNAVPLQVVPGFVVLEAPASLASRLASLPGVARVQVAAPLELHQTSLQGAEENLNLRLTRAHEPNAPTGRGITVAVVDSGIDATHPDLAGRVKANLRLTEGKFVDTPGDLGGHGTHVAGIVAASGASSNGRHRGVAPEADLVGIDISSRFTTASALLAYDWLYVHHQAHGIRVVVNAWGRVGSEPFDPEDAVIRAIDRLVGSGVVVLFSASNHGPAPGTLSMEAQNPRVITVGATDAAARLMDYSSRGPVTAQPGQAPWGKPDVVAPGEAIVSLRSSQSPPSDADPDPLHRAMSGTSQAVPHVAGIVARLLQAQPALTPAEVAAALRASAIDLGTPGPDTASGFGVVDAPDALAAARTGVATRQNPLVAGGTERYQSQHDALETPRRGLLGFAQRPETLWSMEVPVKPGALKLSYHVSGGLGSVSVVLERDGEPVTRGGSQGSLDAPEPGMWTLRVQGVATQPTQARATAEVALPPQPERALQPDSRFVLPDESLTPAPVASDHWLAQARLWVRAHPGVPPTLLAGFLFALALRPHKPPERHVRRIVVLQPIEGDVSTYSYMTDDDVATSRYTPENADLPPQDPQP